MPFNIIEKIIDDKTTLHIVDIDLLTVKLKECIDKHISKIHSNNDFNKEIVKKRILNYLRPKKGSTLETGGIAEFFVHLFLNEKQYKQECLYTNLEENSIKKGFDGYYSKDDEEWIMESKSSDIGSLGVCHKSNINKAYTDLKKKVSGTSSNNPWTNAFNHAMMAKSGEKLLDNVKNLSIEFDEDSFMNIKDLNIIPSSVIFLGNQSNTLNDTQTDIENWLVKKPSKRYKKIHIVCITQKTKDIFWDYLQS